jgi:hypothetical protein
MVEVSSISLSDKNSDLRSESCLTIFTQWANKQNSIANVIINE